MTHHKHIAINEPTTPETEKNLTISWRDSTWRLIVHEEKDALIIGVFYQNDRKVYDDNSEKILDTIHTEKQKTCRLERKYFTTEAPILQTIDALFKHKDIQPLTAKTFTQINQQMTTLMAKLQDYTQTATELSEKIDVNLLELFQTLAPAAVYTVNTKRELTLFNCGKPHPKTDWTPEEQTKTVVYQGELLSFLEQSKTATLDSPPPLPPFLESLLTSATRCLPGISNSQRLRLEQTDADIISVTVTKLLGSREIVDPSGGSDAPKLLDKFCAEKGISAETWTLDLAKSIVLMEVKIRALRDKAPVDAEIAIKQELGCSPNTPLLEFFHAVFPEIEQQLRQQNPEPSLSEIMDKALILIESIQHKEFILGLTNGARGRLKDADNPNGQCGQELSKRAYSWIESAKNDDSVNLFSDWVQRKIYLFRVETLRTILVTANRENTGFENIKAQIDAMAQPHIELYAQGTPLTEHQTSGYFDKVSLSPMIAHLQAVLQKAIEDKIDIPALLRAEGREDSTDIDGMLTDKTAKEVSLQINFWILLRRFCVPLITVSEKPPALRCQGSSLRAEKEEAQTISRV